MWLPVPNWQPHMGKGWPPSHPRGGQYKLKPTKLSYGKHLTSMKIK